MLEIKFQLHARVRVRSAVRATQCISLAPGILQCDVGATDDVLFNAASVWFHRGLSFLAPVCDNRVRRFFAVGVRHVLNAFGVLIFVRGGECDVVHIPSVKPGLNISLYDGTLQCVLSRVLSFFAATVHQPGAL